eukprot:5792360-Pyramimonas_sp.AAC.1
MTSTLSLETQGAIQTIKERLFPQNAPMDEPFPGLVSDWETQLAALKEEESKYLKEHDSILAKCLAAEKGFNFAEEKMKVRSLGNTFARQGGAYKKAKKSCSSLQSAFNKRCSASSGGAAAKKMKLAADSQASGAAPAVQLDEAHISAVTMLFSNVLNNDLNCESDLKRAAPGVFVIQRGTEMLRDLQQE